MIARWQHTLSSTSEFTLQAYYDRTDRDEAWEHEVRDSFDIDFQHRFAAGEWQDIIWGLGYRYIRYDFTNFSIMTIDPDSRSDELFSAFLQDEITLLEERLWLTLGSKSEHNDYTGVEIQPNARLLWVPHPKHKIWAAVSRAVRTPSRAEYDIRLLNTVLPPFSPDNPSPFPIALTVVGDSDYDSEELLAWELGYRIVPAKSLSLDVTAFYNDYDNLRSNKVDELSFQGTHVVQPLPFDNKRKGEIYGIELAAAWQTADWWRLDIAYSYLKTRIDTSNEHDDSSQVEVSPRHQVSLRSAMNFRKDLDMDLWLRYVDDVKAINARATSVYEIDSYLTLDARLAWRPMKDLEFSLVGQNLLDDKHPEFVQESFTLPTEIERSIYGKITWRF